MSVPVADLAVEGVAAAAALGSAALVVVVDVAGVLAAFGSVAVLLVVDAAAVLDAVFVVVEDAVAGFAADDEVLLGKLFSSVLFSFVIFVSSSSRRTLFSSSAV